MNSIPPNKPIELMILRVTDQGLGEAILNGQRYLVPFVLANEKVIALPEGGRKQFVICRLLQVLESSPKRRSPACAHFGVCGGCELQHMVYAEQLALKEQWVRDHLTRSGLGGDCDVGGIIASPQEYRYRNRITLHQEGGAVGYFLQGTNQVLPVSRCELACDEVNGKLGGNLNCCNEQLAIAATGNGRTLCSEFFPGFQPQTLDSRPLASDVNTSARQHVNTATAFELRANSSAGFVQVNTAQNENLIALVCKLAAGRKWRAALDLFAGSGNLSFALKGVAKQVWAVDSDRAAIAEGEGVRVQQGIKGIRFQCATALDAVSSRVEACEENDLIVCDPPREGLGPVAGYLPRLRPKRIIYVSCEPKSFFKDGKVLAANGYRLVSLTPLDMFPQTRHVEVVGQFVQ